MTRYPLILRVIHWFTALMFLPMLIGRALRDRGVGTVVVTTGASGSLLVGEGPVETVPAFDLEVVEYVSPDDAFAVKAV